MKGSDGQRWARPDEPILHTLNDEREQPHTFFHNINYRTSRKYINVEKIKVVLLLQLVVRPSPVCETDAASLQLLPHGQP